MSLPDLTILPDLPADDAGPVFKAPWQAQAFAMVLGLQEKGVFTWHEWADELSACINKARSAGDLDLGDTYYNHWLSALENISVKKGLANPELLAEKKRQAHEQHQKLHQHDH